jgi:hypothetical protein
MTREESTGIRSLEFSQWIRTNLPDSGTGFLVSDIDFYTFNWKTKKAMLLEVKTHGASLCKWQDRMYKELQHWISLGMISSKEVPGWRFFGSHTIIFSGSNFNDGDCRLDGRIVSEQELMKFLSMED